MMIFKTPFNRLRQRAFTLIEMLVVLIIVAMVVTLIIQGFGYTLGLYQRVVKSQNTAYQQVFTYHWLSSSLSSPVAVRPKDRGLEGDASQLSTYSYQPLLAQAGLKTLVQWELQHQGGELWLSYKEGQIRFPVYQWTNATGRFEYLDEQGQWVNLWPMQKSDNLPLPKAVRILVTSGRDSFNYVVMTGTRLRAEVTSDEVLYGRD
jgi:general secretion pathway protein J